jgi:nitroimidazol reductase NimA-like FMN-containing flavoprotein (pyridoxamine 5'-phosphate oxidase superfamily)
MTDNAASIATYDVELIHGILSDAPVLNVSFVPPDQEGPVFPTILPMVGAVGTFDADEKPHVYLHGSSVARLNRLAAGSELPVCVAATLVEGYVLALAPYNNNCNYRSAVLFGHASIVNDQDEIMYALRLITDHINPQRWDNSRKPPTKAEITSTGILKVRINTASGKVRSGGPDNERADLKDEALVDRTWMGVVPVYQVLGEPIPGVHNKVKQAPEYILDWIADTNSMSEQRAIDAAET